MHLSDDELDELIAIGEIGEKAAIYIVWLEAKLERIRKNFAEMGEKHNLAPIPRKDRKKQRRY